MCLGDRRSTLEPVAKSEFESGSSLVSRIRWPFADSNFTSHRINYASLWCADHPGRPVEFPAIEELGMLHVAQLV
jgi:hypothetical protein